jgi:membrane protein required for colicin V production
LNIIDIAIIIVLLYTFLKGFFNGFINEFSSFIGFLIAGLVSYNFFEPVASLLIDFIEIDKKILNAICLIILFIATALIFKIFGKGFTKLIKFISLGVLNRLMGGIFSTVKYIIFFTTISIIYKNFVHIYPEILSNNYVESSNSFQLMIRLGEYIMENFNAAYFI